MPPRREAGGKKMLQKTYGSKGIDSNVLMKKWFVRRDEISSLLKRYTNKEAGKILDWLEFSYVPEYGAWRSVGYDEIEDETELNTSTAYYRLVFSRGNHWEELRFYDDNKTINYWYFDIKSGGYAYINVADSKGKEPEKVFSWFAHCNFHDPSTYHAHNSHWNKEHRHHEYRTTTIFDRVPHHDICHLRHS